MHACKSVLEILVATVEERPKKAGGTFNLFKCVCTVITDEGEVLAGNVEFPAPAGMTAPKPGKYHVQYEPRRDFQDGKIKPVCVAFVPVHASAPTPSKATATS